MSDNFKLIPDIYLTSTIDYEKFILYNKLLVDKLYSINKNNDLGDIDILYMLRPVDSELKIFDLNKDGIEIDKSIKYLSNKGELTLVIVGEYYEKIFALIRKEVRVKYLGLVLEQRIAIRLESLERFSIKIPSGGTDIIEKGDIISISNVGEYSIIKIEGDNYNRNLTGSRAKLYIDLKDNLSGEDIVKSTKIKTVKHFTVPIDYNENTIWFITSRFKENIEDIGVKKESIEYISNKNEKLYFIKIIETDWCFNEGYIEIKTLDNNKYKIKNSDLLQYLLESRISNLTYDLY